MIKSKTNFLNVKKKMKNFKIFFKSAEVNSFHTL